MSHQPHTSAVTSIHLVRGLSKGVKLLTSGRDARFLLLDLTESVSLPIPLNGNGIKILHSFGVHTSPILCLAYDGVRIASADSLGLSHVLRFSQDNKYLPLSSLLL